MKRILVVFSLLFIFILVGCSSKKTSEIENRSSYNFVYEDSNYPEKIVLAEDGYVYIQNSIYKDLTKLSKTWERKDYMILIKDIGSKSHSDIYYISNDGKILVKYIGDKPYIYIVEE